LADDAHSPQSARQLESLGNGRWRSGKLDDNVRSFPAGQLVYEGW
jgi:hypothetical protein